LTCILPLFGCPMVVGALPHSPQFADSLAQKETVHEKGSQTTKIVKVYENRISPFLVNGAVVASLVVVGAMKALPHCVICDALFLFMGLTGLQGNQLFERLLLLVTEEALYPPLPFTKEQVPHTQLHLYTMIQFAAAAVPFIVVQTQMALAFPICLLLTIPLRMGISKITGGRVTRQTVAILDGGDAEMDTAELDLSTEKV